MRRSVSSFTIIREQDSFTIAHIFCNTSIERKFQYSTNISGEGGSGGEYGVQVRIQSTGKRYTAILVQ